MKRFKLLLVALATVSFGALTSCGGQDDQASDSDSAAVEVVTEEPEVVTEETPDSLKTEEVTADSTATEEVTADSTATEEAQ